MSALAQGQAALATDPRRAAALAEAHLAQHPGDLAALKLRAKAWVRSAPAEALGAVEAYTRVTPQDPDGHDLAGQALSAMGRGTEAVGAFTQAANLAPDRPNYLANLSVSQSRVGEHARAETSARRALALSPGFAPGFNALGHALHGQGQYDEAIDAFAEVLDASARDIDALMGIGRAQMRKGALGSAILTLRRACLMAPSRTEPLSDLAVAYRQAGDQDLAAEAHAALARLIRPGDALQSNVLLDMQYDPATTPEAIAAQERSFGEAAMTRGRGPALGVTPDPGGPHPLRIGYVSGDLGQHAVGWLVASALAAHDPNKVEVTYYDTGGLNDAVTQMIRNAPATRGWVDLRATDDATAAARIAGDGIDILIDLAGHTRANRLGVFARRAAPIQMGWLGYPGSSGLPTMDYALFDHAHAPSGVDRLFCEHLIRLPRLRFAYAPPDGLPDVGPPPSLAKGHVTFGCFNNTSKLNRDVIATWSQILEALPESRLHLKWKSYADPMICDRLRARFARHGIDPARIEFSDHAPHLDMLATYDEIDVALDPFPFSGGVSTAEALIMGVPVVSLYGARTVSRQGLAILSAAGHPEWATDHTDTYIETALALARDETGRAAIRAEQRAKVLASELCDGPGLARAVEAVFADAVRAFAPRA